MKIAARPAAPSDLDSILALYRALEEEQTALRHMWRLADGLPEPAAAALAGILDDPDSMLVVGELDDVVLGFAWAEPSPLLPQADDDRVVVVRLIHTDAEARGVGIGEAMIELIMERFRAEGVSKFDAIVSPGHRNAKNFFESQGFKARRITMNLDDDPPPRTTLPGGMTKARAVRGARP